MFPNLLSFLALVLYALGSSLFRAALVAALLSVGVGLALRRQRRAAVVVFSMFIATAFALLVLMGVLVPLTWFVLTGKHQLTAPIAVLDSTVLAGFTAVRTCAALRREFGGPLENAPGVSIGSEGVFLYRLVPRAHPLLVPVAWIGLTVLILGVILFHGTDFYLVLILVVTPMLCALLCVDPVARALGLFIALRRWERVHGKRLRLLPLDMSGQHYAFV